MTKYYLKIKVVFISFYNILIMKKISVPVSILSKKFFAKKVNGSYKNAMIAIQHNNLVEAKYSMTLQQKRVMIWLVSQIKPDDIDFKEHTLGIKELIEICQLSGESSYKEIRNITFSLIEKGIRIIDITDPSNKREIQVAWLSSADYYQGKVKLSFSPKLKPYLLQLKEKFTAINVIDLMQF
ncbi:MAG: RepB family plasmid replication initiator protein, partial [Synechococcaceae bacterium WB7_1C_051]|nr:RepB family plasmid replication initiator protein [Synechococcaceae bacterium WB7_1C_051]